MSTETATREPKAKAAATYTQEQFDEAVRAAASKLVDEKLEAKLATLAAQQQQVIFQPHHNIDEKEGVVVPPGYVPKDKSFTTTPMTNGTLVLTKLSTKPDFNPVEREKVMDAVFAKYANLTRDIAGQEKPKPPKKMFVTSRFRELFENLSKWDDAAEIITVRDDQATGEDFTSIKSSTVRFRFEK